MRQLVLLICISIPTEAILMMNGAGASFPGGLYSQWCSVHQYHRQQFVDMECSYVASHSWEGKHRMLQNDASLSYGGTDADLTPEEYNTTELRLVPVVAGGVVLIYNIPGIMELNLSRDHVVGIYNGTYQQWDDPSIQELNPQAPLPGFRIRVVVRADYSGTTEIFTHALSAISPQWNDTYGTFAEGKDELQKPAYWNASVVSLYGRYNRGVSTVVFSNHYSIGYMSVDDAVALGWPYVKLFNKAGNRVDVRPLETAKVMLASFDSGDFDELSLTGSLVDSPLDNAYPILGFSYFLIDVDGMASCDLAAELYRYVEWILTEEPRHLAEAVSMTGIVEPIASLVTQDILLRMTCENQRSVEEIVRKQKTDEAWQENYHIYVIIAVGVAVGGSLILGLIIYCIIQQCRLRKALNANEWYIPESDIEICWTREKGHIAEPGSTVHYPGFGSSYTQQTVTSVAVPWPSSVTIVGRWAGSRVLLREGPRTNFKPTKQHTKLCLTNMKLKVSHVNVLRFLGVTCSSDGAWLLVSDYAEKGCLCDVLQNPQYRLDENLRHSLALDVAAGMTYLHTHGFTHGSLTSSCCLLDGKWNVKVSDWETWRLMREHAERKSSRIHPASETSATEVQIEHTSTHDLFWVAPEMFRTKEASQPADVYSFGILMVEVFGGEEPYEEYLDTLEPEQVLDSIIRLGLRPNLEKISNSSVQAIIANTLKGEASQRPTFSQLMKRLQHSRRSKRSVIESLMETLEGYVAHLEDKVRARTTELEAVNDSLEGLLYQILPPSVAGPLSKGEAVPPEQYDSVTIYFSDIVGFTAICAVSSPMEVVTLLNDLYTLFDATVDGRDVYKVETIGDSYMCISGLPERNGHLHVRHIAVMALKFLHTAREFVIPHRPLDKLRIRSGFHTGPVVAGVVGTKMPRYCLFGDTVNTASRMESSSLPMRIQVSADAYALLKSTGGFTFETRGQVDVKGKGSMQTYFLCGCSLPEEANERSDLPDAGYERRGSLQAQLLLALPRSSHRAKPASPTVPSTVDGKD